MASRFKKLTERFGFRIRPISTKINGKLQRRPDILGVFYHGEFCLVIPKRMYGFPVRNHRDLLNNQHPDYFTCEMMLFNYIRKQTDGWKKNWV